MTSGLRVFACEPRFETPTVRRRPASLFSAHVRPVRGALCVAGRSMRGAVTTGQGSVRFSR
jgi:hypothetical protein